MKKTLTNEEILNLMDNLVAAAKGDYVGLKFNYALSKNRSKLKEEYRAIMTAVKFPEDMMAFVKDWVMLSQEQLIAKVEEQLSVTEDAKDEKGNLIHKDAVAFGAHKAMAEKTSQKLKDNQAFLKESKEIDLYEIPLSLFPEDIKGIHFAGIDSLIPEESDALPKKTEDKPEQE